MPSARASEQRERGHNHFYLSFLFIFCEELDGSMARANSSRATATERLVLIPAIDKRNTTGYKSVTYNCSKKKFQSRVQDGGKGVSLGYFDTAEEAAVAYARSEYGRADAAKLLQPRAAPTAASAKAIRQAEREGLTLTASSNSSGYKGVTFKPKERGSKKYELRVWVGGKKVFLGMFATAEQAALFYARREAGRDTSDLTAPPPPPPPPAPSSDAGAEAVRQAEREGLTLATSSGSNSGYRGVCYNPKQKGRKKFELKVTVGGKHVFLGLFATAEEAALFYARSMAATRQKLGGLPPKGPERTAFERWQSQQRKQRGAQAESETEEEEEETEEEEEESEAEEEEAAGPAAASAAQAAPSAGSRLQRSSQRKRPAEACSTDAEVAELGLALARSDAAGRARVDAAGRARAAGDEAAAAA